ncbi:MAG: hypothetical protein AB8H47_27145 [Bacteroidia bacterium]
MNKAELQQQMGISYLHAIGYATLRACWTASAIIGLAALLMRQESWEFAAIILGIGSIVSLLVSTLHSVIVLGFLTMMYRPQIQSDTAGMLFGRWWLIHSFTVWMIPAIMMVSNQIEEIEAWAFLVGITVNSTVVLWLFCKRYIARRDIAIIELRKKDREAAINSILPS